MEQLYDEPFKEANPKDFIYVQWYPSWFRAGFVAQHPSKEDLEEFYDNVNASDPHHNSFVIMILEEKHIGLFEINQYIKDNILKCFFNT